MIMEAEKSGGMPGAPEAGRGQKAPPLGSLEGSTLPSPWFRSRDNRYRTSGLQDCETIISAVGSHPGALLQHAGAGAVGMSRKGPAHTQKHTGLEGDVFGGRCRNVGAGGRGEGQDAALSGPHWEGSPETWGAKAGGKGAGVEGRDHAGGCPTPPSSGARPRPLHCFPLEFHVLTYAATPDPRPLAG